MDIYAGCVATCTAASIGATVLGVGALGFGALGVAASSAAALFQSACLGGTIASGSLFSVLQSIGMAGTATTTKAAIASACAALCAKL